MSSNLFEDLNEFADGMFNFSVHFFLHRNMIAVQFLPSTHDNKALRLFRVCHPHSMENHEAEDCQAPC